MAVFRKDSQKHSWVSMYNILILNVSKTQNKMKKILIVLLVVFISGCSNDEKVSAELVNFGITKNSVTETEIQSDSVAGQMDVVDQLNFVEKTSDIPTVLGVSFGIEYSISGNYDTIIEEVIIFPGDGLTNPETGETRKQDSGEVVLEEDALGFFGYGFDYAWEAVPGEWLFQVKADGVVLIEQKFNIN